MACSGAVWGDGLTVTITKKGGVTETKAGQASLESALSSYASNLGEVEGIEVSAGNFTEADWNWLKAKRKELSGLKKFVVTEGVGSVADIPDTDEDKPYFGESLKELRVAKLAEVGENAFYCCYDLTSVSLPAVMGIGNSAFEDCTSLNRLQLGATPPSNVGELPFIGCPLVRKLELIKPDSTALAGDTLTNAKSNYKAANDGDTEDNLWYGWAFEEFPSSNLSGTIDGVPFTDATSLEVAMQGRTLDSVKELTITGGTFQIPDWGYLLEKGQDSLKIEQFTIENSVGKVADIPDLSYADPRYLPNAQIVRIEKVQKVGVYAFDGCTSLKSVSLPVATNIGGSAFDGCENLKSVSLPVATIIGDAAFRGCKNLESVSLPAATKIFYCGFSECTGLKSVSLPKIADIGRLAFNNCTSLKTLKLGATPPSVGADTFWNCPSELTLIITDAAGVPLVGAALTTAAAKYDRKE